MADFKRVVPVLKVSDMQKSVDFYTGVLGFSVAWRTASPVSGCIPTRPPFGRTDQVARAAESLRPAEIVLNPAPINTRPEVRNAKSHIR